MIKLYELQEDKMTMFLQEQGLQPSGKLWSLDELEADGSHRYTHQWHYAGQRWTTKQLYARLTKNKAFL
jgi:hypothetical protein